MLSKWQIWDFFSSVKHDYLEGASGVIALNTFDFQSLKLVKDHLLKKLPVVIHHKLGPEVSSEWINDEFLTLNLFGGSESFFIHQAQEIAPDILQKLLELELQDRFIILSFETDSALFKKITKEKKIKVIQVEAPRFWEFSKLLDFTASLVRLPLSYEAKNWILASLENNFLQFYNSCCLLKLNYPQVQEITLEQVKRILEVERLDSFHLANVFGKKRFQQFFGDLLQVEGDFERMRGFFLFMQSHLIKIADPSYLDTKERLTQYDKGILQLAKIWKPNELLEWVKIFNDLEIKAKKKDSSLWGELQLRYIRAEG